MPNLAWFALKRVNAQKGCSTTSLQSPIHIINLVDKINNLCMTWYDMILMLDQTKLTKVPPVKSDTEINLPIHNPSLFSSGILTALGTCIFIIYVSISAHDKLSLRYWKSCTSLVGKIAENFKIKIATHFDADF